MSGNAMAQSLGVLDGLGIPASSRVPVNTRVQCEAGPIGILPEVLSFTGVPTVVGNWVSGTVRVSVNGIPAINTQSIGTGYSPVGSPTGPLQVAVPSTRLSIT